MGGFVLWARVPAETQQRSSLPWKRSVGGCRPNCPVGSLVVANPSLVALTSLDVVDVDGSPGYVGAFAETRSSAAPSLRALSSGRWSSQVCSKESLVTEAVGILGPGEQAAGVEVGVGGR